MKKRNNNYDGETWRWQWLWVVGFSSFPHFSFYFHTTRPFTIICVYKKETSAKCEGPKFFWLVFYFVQKLSFARTIIFLYDFQRTQEFPRPMNRKIIIIINKYILSEKGHQHTSFGKMTIETLIFSQIIIHTSFWKHQLSFKINEYMV